MEFSRDEKNRIRCVITEEEIEELGFTVEEIVSNGARTQEFMNQIFDMAEDELQTKFEMGIKTVRADFLSDHTLSLTFSEHPSSEGMLEHIKDIVNGLINSIPQQKWDEIKAKKGLGIKEVIDDKKSEASKDEQLRIIVLFAFEEMDILMRFAKQLSLEVLPYNDLYKLDDTYFLMVDLSEAEEEDVRRISALIDEYATDVFVGAEKRAFIYEHGKAIIKEKAIEQLKLI